MKTVKIGLLGIGNVGSGAFQIISLNAASIAKSSGRNIIAAGVLARDKNKKRDIDINPDIITDDPDEILKNPEIDIIVEALGGIEPATTFMLSAMKNGKHVVTANKAAVAANYDKLTSAAAENGVQFKFEASVSGGIPILNAIDTVLRGNEFTEIMGIVNGTTNYILTKMTEEQLPYDVALKNAQELGFAEADPTADVEGIDVANKLTILIALAFGQYIKPEDIPTTGISKITASDIEEAAAKGCKIKLIAHVKMNCTGGADCEGCTGNGKLEYSVKPMLLPNDHPLAGVSNEFNAVFVTGNAVGELMFYGRGAGALPTGSAVVGDIIEIAKTIK